MNIIVSNMIEIEDVSYKVQKYFQNKLTFDNPEYIKRVKYRIARYGVPKKIEAYYFDAMKNSLFIPVSMLDQVLNVVENPNVKYIFGNDICAELQWNREIKLRDYQEEALNAITKRSGVLIAPAGSGKTVMGLRYIYEINQPSIWLTHTIELLQQAKERIEMFMENHGYIGMIGDNTYNFGDGKILLSTYQSLYHNPSLIHTLNSKYNVIVVDEAHHIPAAAFSEIVNKLVMQYKLGLTATPERKDGLEFLLYLAIGKMLHEIPRALLYEDEALIRPRVHFIFTDFQDNINTKISENNAVDAGGEEVNFRDITDSLYEDDKRVELIANNIVENIAEGNYQIILSESIDYAYKIKEKVDELIRNFKGIRTEIVHGPLARNSWIRVKTRREAYNLVYDKKAIKYKYDRGHKVLMVNYSDAELKRKQIRPKKRKEIMEDFKNKKIHILFATKLAREGLDIPHLNIGHCVSARKGDTGKRMDGNVLEQEVGRLMRPDPMNPFKEAIWYDYVDYNCGILKSQYYSRRKVYTRLGLKMNAMDKAEHFSKVQEFLHDNDFFV